MKAIDFLHKTFKADEKLLFRPVAVMADGFFVSIQGGTWCHHSSPQPEWFGNPIDEYETLELGFPSELDDLLIPYAEADDTNDTVFNEVPLSIVEKLVAKHGGIVNGESA